jgi:hypothetical protein
MAVIRKRKEMTREVEPADIGNVIGIAYVVILFAAFILGVMFPAVRGVILGVFLLLLIVGLLGIAVVVGRGRR